MSDAAADTRDGVNLAFRLFYHSNADINIKEGTQTAKFRTEPYALQVIHPSGRPNVFDKTVKVHFCYNRSYFFRTGSTDPVRTA
jgi:hypothetical protein